MLAMSEKQWSIVKWSAVGEVALVIVGVPLWPGRTVPVTRERLAAAREQWATAKIADYDLEWEVSGAQVGRYHVEVRGGNVARMTLNGRGLTSNAPEYFTIDGLLQTIEEYVDHCEHPSDGAFPEGSKIWLRMRTHSTLGYPVRFIKEVKMPATRGTTGYDESGAALGVEFRVIRLEPRTSP